MEGAINSTTRKYITALGIELNPSYQFPKEEVWYADPNDILDYNKEKVKDITKIEVRFRKGSESVINWNGTEYSIAPCFFIPNKTELEINTIPESKEHKLAKNWVYNRIKNKKLSFIFSSVNRPWDYANIVNISELEIDYEKVGIETTVKNNRTQRADIIIPFKKYSELFGFGIIIEIQFSKQYDLTTYERNNEWAFKGYSVCWIWDTDFKNISNELIEINDDKLKLEPIQKIIKDFSEKNLEEYKHKIQELSRMIDLKMKELNYPFCIGECKKCYHGYMTKKKSKFGNWFYSCSNWKDGCKHTINIENDSD